MAAHLITNQKTNKFIPVVKNVKNRRKLPEFLHNRFYVDMSDSLKFDFNLKWIVNEIKGIPRKNLTTNRPIKIYPAEMCKYRDEVFEIYKEFICDSDSNLISFDKNDLCSVAIGDTLATARVSVWESLNSAEVAAKSLLISFTMSSIDINKAKGLIVGITGNDKMTMDDYETICKIIHENMHEDTNVSFGLIIDENILGVKLDSLVSL